MNVQDRIASDQHRIEVGQGNITLDHVEDADLALQAVWLPTYTQVVNTLLAWHRASDQCKAAGQDLGAQNHPRRPGARLAMAELELAKKDAIHRLNELIDHLPRGI